MMAAIPPDLPICEVLPDLLRALSAGNNAVLVAPPGAGKTTAVPLALLNAPWIAGRKIIMLAPRRLAARTAAARMASLLGEAVGQTVGYRVRLDTKVSHKTRIEIVTEGIFTRMILADPELTNIAIVIFDEVHERNLEGDLALALALDAQAGLRNDLRLLAMSATLDGARISSLMGDAPSIESTGRMFPVETHYVGAMPNLTVEHQAADVALRALQKGPGDVLVFLPGAGEINRAITRLAAHERANFVAVALHGGLEPRAQDIALAPSPNGARKIILSTSIAETSLTIPGVQIVVDCGLTRRAAYEPDSGLTRLVTVRVSRASAEQRRGRAGRTAPGLCFRLWEEAQGGAFPAFDRPEILEADLAPLVLSLASWGVSDPAKLSWLDAPPLPAWREAVALLADLGALSEQGRITAHGTRLAAFGLPPRLSHMIVAAAQHGLGKTAAWVAAVLSERGLGGTGVDLSSRLTNLQRDNSQRATKAKSQADGWARQVGARDPVTPEHAGKVLALAFPERIAKARDRRGGFILCNGRGAEMMSDEPLASQAYLAVGALQGRAANARISEAATLSREDLNDLFMDKIKTATVTIFDRSTRTLRSRVETRLGALVLEALTAKLTPDQIAKGLFEAVQSYGLPILNWTPRAILLRGRLAWLHKNGPDLWPEISDVALMAQLDDWLTPALIGAKKLDDVDLYHALTNRLDWSTQQRLATQAPEQFVTPADTSYAIDYAPEQGPSVHVRVQEVYGLTLHPMVSDGQVPLIFHLSSPAHRPIAVTANLPAFWKGAWADVRKDMKARYPRHVWPEDPSNAAPTTRVKPRGS